MITVLIFFMIIWSKIFLHIVVIDTPEKVMAHFVKDSIQRYKKKLILFLLISLWLVHVSFCFSILLLLLHLRYFFFAFVFFLFYLFFIFFVFFSYVFFFFFSILVPSSKSASILFCFLSNSLLLFLFPNLIFLHLPLSHKGDRQN